MDEDEQDRLDLEAALSDPRNANPVPWEVVKSELSLEGEEGLWKDKPVCCLLLIVLPMALVLTGMLCAALER